MQIKVKNLRKAYEKAVKENKDQFTYKGVDFVTAYAKYLLIYIRDNLKLSDMDYITLTPNTSN